LSSSVSPGAFASNGVARRYGLKALLQQAAAVLLGKRRAWWAVLAKCAGSANAVQSW
jgi:hypothetical protein